MQSSVNMNRSFKNVGVTACPCPGWFGIHDRINGVSLHSCILFYSWTAWHLDSKDCLNHDYTDYRRSIFEMKTMITKISVKVGGGLFSPIPRIEIRVYESSNRLKPVALHAPNMLQHVWYYPACGFNHRWWLTISLAFRILAAGE